MYPFINATTIDPMITVRFHVFTLAQKAVARPSNHFLCTLPTLSNFKILLVLFYSSNQYIP